jgi:hypothetical protein
MDTDSKEEESVTNEDATIMTEGDCSSDTETGASECDDDTEW